MGIERGSGEWSAVAAVIRRLAEQADLPAPTDLPALLPPTHAAFARRVPGHNLWLWFTTSADRLVLVTITDTPPVPVL